MPQIHGWMYTDMESAYKLIGDLFIEQEVADLQVEKDGDIVKWRVAKDDGTPILQERDIPVSDNVKTKISKFLVQLNDEEKLNFEHMTLYRKFVG